MLLVDIKGAVIAVYLKKAELFQPSCKMLPKNSGIFSQPPEEKDDWYQHGLQMRLPTTELQNRSK